MSAFCASSARLALPTLLRNVYRSEFASELHPPQCLVSRIRESYPRRRFNNGRSFTSLSRLLASQPHMNPQPSSQPAITESGSEQQDVTEGGSVDVTSARRDTAHRDRQDPNKPARKMKMKKKPASSQPESDANSAKSSRDKKHGRSDQISPDYKPRKKKEDWQIQKDALKKKFKDGWNPSKKLSP
ncbi:hypothetical protein BDV26DRAFT_270495, partial [Aspergillus bertholletiae]